MEIDPVYFTRFDAEIGAGIPGPVTLLAVLLEPLALSIERRSRLKRDAAS
jgi:hypothetical protein